MKGHLFLISLLPIPENLGLKKLCCHDSLWHLTLFLLWFAVNVKGLHIVCTPHFLLGGCWTSNQIFLVGPQLLERVAGKEGMTFFRGQCNFLIQKKWKSEIFNNKKSLQAKIHLSVITNNSNWRISPKDLVLRWYKDEQLNILGVHWRIWLLASRFTKNQYRGGLPEKVGTWAICRFRRAVARKR